jgi:hypothetical protein
MHPPHRPMPSPLWVMTQATPPREAWSFMARLSLRAIWNAAFVLFLLKIIVFSLFPSRSEAESCLIKERFFKTVSSIGHQFQ